VTLVRGRNEKGEAMHRRTVGRYIPFALAFLLFLPLAASAQSTLAGLVRDESGGVLPGVTVEASSPVLIEKVRSGITDEQGRYRIVDLRPGTYQLTFALTGFSTVVRSGVEVPSNLTVTINADLKVGTLQETVTVSGAAPVVDVQQASMTQVMTRDIIDALPTSRNIMSVGQVVLGVRSATPDIGGSRTMEQPSMRAHGVNNRETTQLVDGQSIQSYETSLPMTYWDDALQSEVSLTTNAIPADTSGGGMRLNAIPKDGGNVVSGSVFLGGTDGNWQSKNIDDALRARNIASANGIAHIQNFNASMGGPVKKDKLWFFTSVRHMSSDETVANTAKQYILSDGTVYRTVLDQFVRDTSLRLTWQVSQQHKFSTFFSRIWKRKGHDFSAGVDPRAGQPRDAKRALYGVGQARWSSTLSSKFMVEGGYSTAINNPVIGMPDESRKVRGTPEWYASAQRTDTAYNKNPDCIYATGCTQWMSANWNKRGYQRHVVAASASYVTGTHNLKVGVQDTFGPARNIYDRNADLVEAYVNNKPSTVTVYNTPILTRGWVNRDMGVYAQDSWTIGRLTLTPGVRAEWFKSGMQKTSMPAGRFAPFRDYAAQPNMPDWGPDWAPRFSAAYDLFGDGRTALKANASKYFLQYSDTILLRYANAVQSSDSRNWFDADLIPGTSTISGVALATNGDGIAQDNEIGPSSSSTFGLRSDRNPAPDLQRVYHWEYTGSVQHQLLPRVSVTGAYFHRIFHGLENTDRTLITNADYTSFTLPMPSFSNDPTLSGVLDPNEIITVYNLNSAKRSVWSSAQVDRNGDDQSIYDGVEASFSARLPNATVFGGWTMEKNVSVFCSSDDDPNGVSTSDLYLGDTASSGGRFCDQRNFDVPFQHQFKLSGTYTLPFSVDFGAVLQSYPGQARVITWQPAASLFPGGSRTNSETIILTKPGQLYLPRYNQLDVNFRKNFRSGRKRFSLQFDLFNVLNGNSIFSTNNAIGSSLGQVTSILMGRLPRLAFQMQW
jgi:hypothetical protein